MPCNHKKALDLASAGKWDEAHQSVQSAAYASDRLACLIHGYLHRVEGDLDNARYWYGQAGAKMPNNTLEEELARLYGLVDG